MQHFLNDITMLAMPGKSLYNKKKTNAVTFMLLM